MPFSFHTLRSVLFSYFAGLIFCSITHGLENFELSPPPLFPLTIIKSRCQWLLLRDNGIHIIALITRQH